MLVRFGVSKLSFSEDLDDLQVAVNFVYNGCPVVLRVDYGNLAQTYLKDKPHTYQMRRTSTQYYEHMIGVAYRASYSLLEDYLKGTLTMVELKAKSFEEAFIGSFVNRDGHTLGEVMTPLLQDFVGGQLALTPGEQQ